MDLKRDHVTIESQPSRKREPRASRNRGSVRRRQTRRAGLCAQRIVLSLNILNIGAQLDGRGYALSA